jgi:general secretion pathway protein G
MKMNQTTTPNGAEMQLQNENQKAETPEIPKARAADLLQSQRGMTLVEIMIVVTIMASIMGVVGFFVFGALKEANMKQASIQISNYEQLVETYYLTTDPHVLPDSLEDLATKKRLAEEIKPDPWGQPYVYRKTGSREFEILSVGPDGTQGTEDDISNKASE